MRELISVDRAWGEPDVHGWPRMYPDVPGCSFRESHPGGRRVDGAKAEGSKRSCAWKIINMFFDAFINKYIYILRTWGKSGESQQLGESQQRDGDEDPCCNRSILNKLKKLNEPHAENLFL